MTNGDRGRSSIVPRRRKRQSVFFLHVMVYCSAEAGWIDPDTPLAVYTTKRLNVRLRDIPKQSATDDDDVPLVHRHRNHTPSPTTIPPTVSPTESPTAFPTYDPDTEPEFHLVFSDEFNVAGREFRDGADPRWTALDKNDYTNDALHYYSPAAVTTADGELHITTESRDADFNGFDDVRQKRTRVTKHVRSGMVQSWNKFCLTGGIIEARVTLPGHATLGGLWPAFWLLGNLARHTYVSSSEHIWPWSTATHCDKSLMRAQQVSPCDHVSRFDMPAGLGRGAPEIDVFEVQAGSIKANIGQFLKSPVGQPFMSSSYQVAPGRRTNRPGPGEWPGPDQWYSGLLGGRNTSLNILFYGAYNHFRNDVDAAKQDYWSDAISMNRQLNESYFSEPHVYRLEWDVPTNETDGYLHWFLDDELVYAINGTGLRQSGTLVSTEPSYILLNTAVSTQWGFPKECPNNCICEQDQYNCNSKRWQNQCGFSEGFCNALNSKNPPVYKIDWVRAYQNPKDPKQKVGCSTPERPTRKYIVAHAENYKTEYDEHPLRGVPVGLGTCDGVADCGGDKRGRCTPGHVCECLPNWTGPHCRAAVAYDDIRYDEPDRISDVGFVPPQINASLLYGLIGLFVLLVVGIFERRRLAGWDPIPDIKYSSIPSRRQATI